MGLNRFEQLRHHISEIEGNILSASELARLLNVSTALITRIEKGELPPSQKVAARLEEKYGISKEWYLTGEEITPWDEEKQSGWFDYSEQIARDVAEGRAKPGSDKIHAGFGALCLLLKTPQKKLADYFIEAGRNSEFRQYIYNVLEGGVIKVFQELRQARQTIKELKSQLEVKSASMKGDPAFESTEVILEFPNKPADLSKEELERWDQNELALRRWEKTSKAFEAPTDVLEKFCRQVVGLYAGGKPKDIGDLLKDFMEDNKK